MISKDDDNLNSAGRCSDMNHILAVMLVALVFYMGIVSYASPQFGKKLVSPDLSGTPFAAFSAAEAWVKACEQDVVQSMSNAAADIQGGGSPEVTLVALEARLSHNKQIISSKNGLAASLLLMEQKMTNQIAEVEKMSNDRGLDTALIQQYAAAVDLARNTLSSYHICRGGIDVLGRKLDSALASISQWKQFYKATVGIMGAEAAGKKLGQMMARVGVENYTENPRVDEVASKEVDLTPLPMSGAVVDKTGMSTSSVPGKAEAINTSPLMGWGLGNGFKQGLWGPLILMPSLRPSYVCHHRQHELLQLVWCAWSVYAPPWGHAKVGGYVWGYLLGLLLGFVGPLVFFLVCKWEGVATFWLRVGVGWAAWLVFILIPLLS